MRLRSLAFLATMALVGMMASSAFAQPGGAGGRGGRGVGGFGGMGGRQTALSLAGNEAVQKELGLTDDQIAKVKTLNETAREELRGGNDGFAGLRDLPEAERRAKMEEMTAKRRETEAKVTEKYKPKLAEVLDAKQVTRLDQITLQAAGAQAYSDPAVAKALKLTQDQQDKLASISKEAGEKTRELFGAGGGGGGGGNMEKVREINAARDKDLAAVLTADQATQFASMKGKEFDVAALRRGPGGPGGGQGGQGRGNGGRQRPAQ